MILIDCPWHYATNKYKPPYQTLTEKELKLLPLKQITKDNSMILVWTTGPMKDKAMNLIKHWGFTYQTSFIVWNKIQNERYSKGKKNQPHNLSGKFSDPNTEELLVATRGQVEQFIRPEVKINQLLTSPVTRHSEKPAQLMHIIKKKFRLDRMKCLELFARKRIIDEFDLYGNELEPNFQPACDKQSKQQAAIYDEANYTQHIVYERKSNRADQKYALTQKLYSLTDQRITLDTILNLSDQQKIDRVENIMERIINLSQHHMTRANLDKVKNIVNQYITIFAFEKSEFGLTDVLQHVIELEKDARPLARHPYKVAPLEAEFIEKEIKLLLLLNCIEASVSNWASPIVLVRKANGDLRMCIDYRYLNKVTIRDQYPLPRIDQVLIKVCQGLIFSKLDLKSGFWQVSVYVKDRPKTSFVSHIGTYQWKRMPFGLTNAPATFQRLMCKILQKFSHFVVVYIDDIIIFSKTPEEHMEHLTQVFNALQEANLRLGHDKCTFFQKQIDILGHTISQGQYKPLESRVAAIKNIARPLNMKQVQIFLGLVNYHGQFIKNLAKIAQPLRLLTRKGVEFVWGKEQEEAFEKLKYAIQTTPILYIPLNGKLMILYTDFSNIGLGAVLVQETEPNVERVIEYASRVLRKHEKNYPAYKGEILAVYWATRKFRQYILQAPFRLVMDNKAAVALLEQYKAPENLNTLQQIVLNWVLELQQYTFTPVHRPGIKHNNADSLSRLLTEEESEQNKQSEVMNHMSFITTTLSTLQNDPQLVEDSFCMYGLFWWGENPHDVCIKCRKKFFSNNDILICDCCGKNIHQFCHQPIVKVIPPGPWYCYECTELCKDLDTADPTLDFDMIEYLKEKTIPDHLDSQDVEQMIERSKEYIYEKHRLFKKQIIDKKISYFIVPTITERRILLNQIHDFLGHTRSQHLYDVISAELYWPTMRSDITKFCNECVHCSQMNPHFVQNPSLIPTQKGNRPFSVLHIDITGDLSTKETSSGNRYICIIVDAFSKWVEVYPIKNKKASTLRKVMWDWVKRYGSPQVIISDLGSEFKGEFHDIIKDMRSEHLTIMPRNPQANGMAERTIKTVKKIMRRFMNSPTQDVEWDEAASSVQLSVNTATSQSTKYSPYEIVFGRKISYPSSVVMDPPLHPHNQEPTEKEIDNYVQSLKESFKTLHPRVADNINKADARNKKYYDARHPRQQTEFKYGDFVMVQYPRTTQLGPIAKGPFMFLRYVNKDRLAAELVDPTKLDKKVIDGKTYYTSHTIRESTSNLSLTRVTRDQFDISKEINMILIAESKLPCRQTYDRYYYITSKGQLLFTPLKSKYVYS